MIKLNKNKLKWNRTREVETQTYSVLLNIRNLTSIWTTILQLYFDFFNDPPIVMTAVYFTALLNIWHYFFLIIHLLLVYH